MGQADLISGWCSESSRVIFHSLQSRSVPKQINKRVRELNGEQSNRQNNHPPTIILQGFSHRSSAKRERSILLASSYIVSCRGNWIIGSCAVLEIFTLCTRGILDSCSSSSPALRTASIAGGGVSNVLSAGDVVGGSRYSSYYYCCSTSTSSRASSPPISLSSVSPPIRFRSHETQIPWVRGGCVPDLIQLLFFLHREQQHTKTVVRQLGRG